MNLVIVHYHLNRGGVTQVVRNHLHAISQAADGTDTIRVMVLHGGRSDGFDPAEFNDSVALDLHVEAVDGLDYSDDECPAAGDSLFARFESLLSRHGFLADDTLIHVHNHSLVRNPSMPGLVQRLAHGGYRLLLQIHDFAEDFRPQNYERYARCSNPKTGPYIYPQAEQIHYAVLNGRDYGILARAGIAPDRRHLLPNPVSGFRDLPDQNQARDKLADRAGIPRDRRLLVYPVRGIRRKNLGEAVLLAALSKHNLHIGFTLAPPNDSVERQSYDRWKSLSDTLSLPCTFELGAIAEITFEDVLAAADAILTTSVAEGFGMVFLEAWLAGRMLTGRNLPDITADFVEQGMELHTLYDSLSIPSAGVDESELLEQFHRSYERTVASFGIALPDGGRLPAGADRLQADGAVDFAQCPPELQESIIRRVCDDNTFRNNVLQHNRTKLESIEVTDAASSLIERNARVIRERYSLPAIGRCLLTAYTALQQTSMSPIVPLPDEDAIVSEFLSPARFHPIRVEP